MQRATALQLQIATGLALLMLPQLAGCTSPDGSIRPASAASVKPVAQSSLAVSSVSSFEAASVGQSVVLIGRSHRPLGQVMTLTGIVIEGPFKGYEGGPNIIVQRIDGIATQEYIRLPIAGSTFEKPKPGSSERKRIAFVTGKTYRLRGYESGSFVGMPPGANDGVPVQTTGYHLQPEFMLTFRAKPEMVDPVTFGPADFLDRRAVLSGTAANEVGHGYLLGGEWRLRSADDSSPWPDWMVGKPAEVEGTIRQNSGGVFRIEGGTRRLTRLADQVGQPVELRGLIMRDDAADQWWLNYRGERVDLPGLAQTQGWEPQFEWEPFVIRGTLSSPGGMDGGYQIRDATWSHSSALRTCELTGREE